MHDSTPGTSEQRFNQYLDRLAAAVGHADRAKPLRAYCTGLLLPGERKSVEPMAARIASAKVGRQYQSMHHFVAAAPWKDEAVLAVAREMGLEALARQGGVCGWVVDDTGWPKQGKHSVGVTRQYCEPLGKKKNCQVAVTLTLVNASASVPIAFRLYLPEVWAKDEERRASVGVPAGVRFATKPKLSLQQIEAALAAGAPKAPVLADAGFGNNTEFRERLTQLGLTYAVGINSTTTVWRVGTVPLAFKPRSDSVRQRARQREVRQPLAVRALALGLSPRAYQKVSWREGAANTLLRSRFAAVRVVTANGGWKRAQQRAPEWLLIEWPPDETEPTRYSLSTLPRRASLKTLVRALKLRWRSQHDYQELKQELGLNQYEGRGWRGLHHHATLTMAAYAFLVAERSLASLAAGAHVPPPVRAPALPAGFRPRGAPGNGARSGCVFSEIARQRVE
ncbi:MAG: IS701 family transposase [Gammaproteobacteria bacterium]